MSDYSGRLLIVALQFVFVTRSKTLEGVPDFGVPNVHAHVPSSFFENYLTINLFLNFD